MSPDELLAKIDALDWDDPTPVEAAKKSRKAPNGHYPDQSTSSLRVVAIMVAIACVMTVLYFVLTPAPTPRIATDEAPAKPISVATSGDAPAPVAAPETSAETNAEASAEAVAVAEERRDALYAHAIDEAEAQAKQQADARRKARKAREAREAERAKLAAQQESERRRKDEARLQAERDAAEAARLAKAREPPVAVPKGPASPKELCANEGGVFARGFCEARACGKAEWRSHPFCVKRIEDQLRSIGQGG